MLADHSWPYHACYYIYSMQKLRQINTGKTATCTKFSGTSNNCYFISHFCNRVWHI